MTTVFLLSIGFCLIAGQAIEKNAICLVRASGDLVTGKPGLAVGLLLTLASAAVIFYGVTLLALRRDPAPWAYPTLLTVAGATVYAGGALLNGACAVGTLGRLARGELGYLATLLGGVAVSIAIPRSRLVSQPPDLPLLEGWQWPLMILAAALAAFLLVRRDLGGQRAWTFVMLGVAVALVTNWQGDWTWLRLAQELQHGVHVPLAALACVVALALGAVLTAAISGRWRLIRPRPATMARECLGGSLMAAGALLIPGGNDTLLAYSLPSGSPHALLAYALIVGWLLLVMRLSRVVRGWRIWGSTGGPA